MSATSTTHAKAIELGKHVIRMTSAAGSGHPSSALALAHLIVELMYKRMRYDLGDPWNPSNDRLVLSIGHAVPIVYAAYADLAGTVGTSRSSAGKLSLDQLSTLRELSSVLDGHPNPAEGFPFFDAATGSLGQGLSVAAGLALGARLDGIDKRIFVIVGDGESREGQVWEAMDFIVDHELANVCAIFSCNGHGQAACVSPQQSADAIANKAAAFGWAVVQVDGHEPAEIASALDRFTGEGKPLAIVARTVKGWGVEMMLGKNFHGKPIPTSDVDKACSELDATGERLGASSNGVFRPAAPAASHVQKASAEITLPPFAEALERAGMGDVVQKRQLATRAGYGVALTALGDSSERVVALDADVSNSTFSNGFAKKHAARFIECKIAEQNMISVAAGLSAAGKIPFASTFAKFVARAVDQIDMAAISRANVKIVGSHAGVSLGADGPSQMAIADVAYFRSMTRTDVGAAPMCHVFQPADGVCAYRCVELMANVQGLCYMRTHRPNAPFLYPLDERFELRGCKQLRSGDHLTVVSCGYMLHTALAAADELANQGVHCSVFDAYTFPLDPTPILSAARSAGGAILTVEDNYIGGLHAELAEAAAQTGEVRVVGMTVRRVPKSAKTPEEVFTYVGVGKEQIVERATTLAKSG
ncbi:MAG: transketolase [Planctomycetes bacterium]|nr:transketolase [Planctomycetota bacterium]